MRKITALAALTALLLASCGNTSKIDQLVSQNAAEVTLNDTDKKVAAEAEKQAQEYWDSASTATAATVTGVNVKELDLSNGDVDYDLTDLTPNLLYAQVFNMVNTPEDYLGKRVKVRGVFRHTTDNANTKDYFAVFIKDAAACCQQGMEFVLLGDHKYPEDYPTENTDIVIEGIFNTYTEQSILYCQLKDASMTVL